MIMERPRRRPDYRLEELDGEVLIYHPTETTVVYCNQTDFTDLALVRWHAHGGGNQHTVERCLSGSGRVYS